MTLIYVNHLLFTLHVIILLVTRADQVTLTKNILASVPFLRFTFL